MLIELLIFATFISTMILLMFKSRFMKIGIDGSGQFEPVYLKILATRIAESINMSIDFADQFYINSERIIQVENVAIKVCLNQDDFKNIQEKKEIPENDAQNWINRCIVGKITKNELDDERRKETNALDYM